MKKLEKSIELGGRKLTLQTGVLAEQAAGAVLARYGDTVVLATVATSPLNVDLGYFPLTVEYQERLYAGGRIKGSRWVKREGRPSDDEILAGRLIDRSIRPLFPKSYKKEVQVMVTVLSVDIENDPVILAAIAASAAVAISSLPWKGPVATLKIGLKDGSYFTNPLDSELSFSDLDLVVTSSPDSVTMIEAGAKEVPEEKILGAIKYGQDEAKKVIDLIKDLADAVGLKKEEYVEDKPPASLVSQVKKLVGDKIESVVRSAVNTEGGSVRLGLNELVMAVSDNFSDEEKRYIPGIIDTLKGDFIRETTLKGKRVDGRHLDEIRPLSIDVGVLPRTHGSAIFQRGQTQVLTVTTLGAPSLEQLIESAEGEESKRYMHHYAMPPYSTGETGRVGFPSRREIGHGALAERALLPVIPAEENFPYTIRVVSEVTSSNGSTSMASVCGSTLSLMDAGVPITSPVSGIAMGLIIKNEKEFAILTDIMGLEDFDGDMDFKVAGTEKGITALQLDVKTLNLTPSILGAAMSQAKEGRAHILKKMLEVIGEPRAKVSAYAPKIKVVKIPIEKIGELIGPGGKTIRKIIAETGAQVEVEDDGSVSISGIDEEAMQKAVSWVEGLTREVKAGEIYEGEVVRIQPFGAFVNILPGKDGMVHVSDMGRGFVKDPYDVVKIGEKIQVRVKEIDDLGRINLSMNLNPALDERARPERGQRFERGGGRRAFSGRRGGIGFDRGQRPQRGGPHFPTSRLLDRAKKDFSR